MAPATRRIGLKTLRSVLRGYAPRSVLLTMLLVPVTPALAALMTFSNPFDQYGTVENATCGPGICAAAEAVNSFIYLNNSYPGIYKNSQVTAGNNTGQNAGTKAALDFALNGWTANGIHYSGYYQRDKGLSLCIR
jgi:hypothetical protein